MNFVDIAVLVLVLLSSLAGFGSGLIRSVFSLVGLVLGIVVASWYYRRFADQLFPLTHNRAFSEAIWFCILALAVMVSAGIVGLAIKRLVHGVGLGWLDRLAGFGFGLLRGALLITVCIMTLAAFFPDTEWLSQAKSAKYFIATAELTTHMTSEELRNRILDGLNDLRKHSPAWLHPQ